MTVSTPIVTWVASLRTLTGVNKSSSLTVTINITAGWEIWVPVQVRYSNVSANALVNVYPKLQGVATYDTVAMASYAIPFSKGKTQQISLRLTTGQYVLQLFNSGPYSASMAILTQMVITGINNV